MKKEIKMEVDSDNESVKPVSVDPCTIDRFCDTAIGMFLSHPDTKTMKLSHVFRSKPMQEDENMLNFDRANNLERSEVHAAFNFYYRKASQTNVVTAESAVTVIKAYVNSGESIEMHPNYPKAPLSAYNLYLNDQGIGKFDKNDEIRKVFSQEPKVKKKYEDLYNKQIREYVDKLQNFLAEETNLNEEHTKFITGRIRTFQRKVDPKSVPKTTRKPKRKAPTKSAFEYFKMTKSGSYTELDGVARDKKLMKKFNKLPDEMRQIFVDLEEGQN